MNYDGVFTSSPGRRQIGKKNATGNKNKRKKNKMRRSSSSEPLDNYPTGPPVQYIVCNLEDVELSDVSRDEGKGVENDDDDGDA
eukprot:GSA120T00001059001.1